MSRAWRHLAGLGEGLKGAGDLAARQEKWLFECLRRNRGTDYGRKFSFDGIRSIADFRKRVPIVTYEDIEPDVRRMANGATNVLFPGQPVAFERTSGSIGGSKLIPYSPHSLKDFQAALLPWLGKSIRQYDIRSGAGYFSISPATRQPEGAAGGIPVGLPDGAYLGEEAIAEFVQVSAVPTWVGGLQDVATWQLATLYWLVRRQDLALISVWSPTFMLTLLDALEGRQAELAGWLQEGAGLSGQTLSADLDALARLEEFNVDRDTRRLWPDLRLISCWADASSRPFFKELEQRLPHAAFQGKGLLSTEGVVTVPDGAGFPVLAADSGFFEFELDDGDLRLGHELGERDQYEVIMTTSGGLYRYRTGDCVTCEGFADSLPVLRFVGRKGLTCDMVGEKLDEGFVLSCLEDIPGFRMLVPVSAPKIRYALVVDKRYCHESRALIERVELRLFANPHYAYARRIGQLDKLSLCEVSQPLDKFLRRLFSGDTRLGDLKVTALRAETDWLETFNGTAT